MRTARSRLLWVMGFLALTLVVVYAAFVYFYSNYKNRLEAELGERLVAVAATAAAAVDDETWTALAAGQTGADDGLRRDLEEVQRVTGVSDIFIFDTEEITLFDLGGRYPVGELNFALITDVEEVTTALAGLPSATALYSSEDAYLKTAYAPVRDREGRIVGGIGVDGSATFFDGLTQVRRTLWVASALVLVGVVLLGAGFARLMTTEAALLDRLRRTETLASMGQMAAMLAHEIRNPLGIIRGAAERTAVRHGIADDEIFRFIPEEVDRLERTLGAYLDFARPGNAGESHDMAQSLHRTLEMVGHELERKGIGLVVDKEEGAFPVRGDAHLVQQAFLNLVLNARDATEPGGTLTVRLTRRQRRAEVEFADTGRGMSEDVRRRATEPFYTQKEQGSGLGLAVVQRVVSDLGGRMNIESKVGEGTVITLSFPLAGDAA